MPEGTLWKTDTLGPDWRRWAKWLIAVTAIGAAGLLVIRLEERVLGYTLTGLAVLLLVIAVPLWVYDLTSAVEVRVVEESEPVIWIRTVGGRQDRFTPDAIATVTLVCTPFDLGSDSDEMERAIFSRKYRKAVLRLRTRSGRRVHGRAAPFVSKDEMDHLMAEWRRVCPGARQNLEYRFVASGTGD